jgi:Reverse transcriptase-like
MTGEYNLRSPNLIPLYKRVRDLLNRFHYYNLEFEHIYRDDNSHADGLANHAVNQETDQTYTYDSDLDY